MTYHGGRMQENPNREAIVSDIITLDPIRFWIRATNITKFCFLRTF
jgi:hypothetical protein